MVGIRKEFLLPFSAKYIKIVFRNSLHIHFICYSFYLFNFEIFDAFACAAKPNIRYVNKSLYSFHLFFLQACKKGKEYKKIYIYGLLFHEAGSHTFKTERRTRRGNNKTKDGLHIICSL